MNALIESGVAERERSLNHLAELALWYNEHKNRVRRCRVGAFIESPYRTGAVIQ